MTGSGFAIAVPIARRLIGGIDFLESGDRRGAKKARFLLRAPVQARGAKKVQGFVARFIASREEFLEFPHWLLRGLQ